MIGDEGEEGDERRTRRVSPCSGVEERGMCARKAARSRIRTARTGFNNPGAHHPPSLSVSVERPR